MRSRVAEEIMRDEFIANNKNRMRSNDDIQRVVFSYISLAENRGRLHYVTSKESMHVKIHKEKQYKKVKEKNPMLFCMNDSEFADDNDRMMAKAYLEKRFPNKSSFEK